MATQRSFWANWLRQVGPCPFAEQVIGQIDSAGRGRDELLSPSANVRLQGDAKRSATPGRIAPGLFTAERLLALGRMDPDAVHRAWIHRHVTEAHPHRSVDRRRHVRAPTFGRAASVRMVVGTWDLGLCPLAVHHRGGLKAPPNRRIRRRTRSLLSRRSREAQTSPQTLRSPRRKGERRPGPARCGSRSSAVGAQTPTGPRLLGVGRS